MLENKAFLDDNRMDGLEQALKERDLMANEAERKYEEVGMATRLVTLQWIVDA